MRIRQTVYAGLRTLAKHSTNVTGFCSVLVTLQKRPGFLGVLGATTALATMVGNVLKPTAAATFLSRCRQLEVPGVDLSGLLLSATKTDPPAGYDWPGEWKAGQFADTLVLIHDHVRSVAHVDGDPQRIVEHLRDVIWTTYSGTVRLAATGTSYYDPLTVTGSQESPGIASTRAREIWRRLAPFVAAGRPRSLLVDGRPGTGKSTAVRWIAEQVGGRSLRIPVSELSCMRPESIIGVVELLRPDVVLIDDFDRAGCHDSVLDMIVRVRAVAKLLVATTNSLENITAAAVRPRRFDECETIDSLGADFVRDYMGETWGALTKTDRAVVELWPMAYLEELRDRAEMIEGVDLAAEVVKLELRLTKRTVAAWQLGPKTQADASGATPKAAPRRRARADAVAVAPDASS